MLLNLCICISLIGSPAYAKNKAKDQSKEEDEVIVVSLGDSYSAGEGIEPFYGQGLAVKEKVTNKDWLAHRSEKSWPGQLTVPGLEGTLSDHKGKNWFLIQQRLPNSTPSLPVALIMSGRPIMSDKHN